MIIFTRTASFICLMGEYLDFIEEGKPDTASLDELKEWNLKFYEDSS